jgi:ATP-dependent exoDNAse (exonuclease V) beta subunit
MIELLRDQLDCFEDIKFEFDPVAHRYTYEDKPFISVTRFIQQFHKPFEQDYWSKKKAEERGVEQEEILREWKKLNDYANEVGTDTHQWIEDYFNQIWKPLPSNLDVIHRINKFNKIHATQLHKLEPLKFEVRVFSKKWKIAGMIDSLFLYRGKIYILDWKTNKEFTDDKHQKGTYEKLLAPFQDYYKNHHNEYSIQLSMYSLILEEWGFEVGGAYIVHIGPGDEDASIHSVVDMRENLKLFLNGSIPEIEQ